MITKGEIPWIDTERCTGCGACVGVCPVEAIALIDGRAHLDEASCTGCAACLIACPEDAIQPVVKGEIIQMRRDLTAAEKRPVPAPPRYHPLVDTAAPVLAVAGAGLLAKITRAASQLVGRWLSQPSSETQIPQPERRQQPEGNRGNGRRLRVRHRRRGR